MKRLFFLIGLMAFFWSAGSAQTILVKTDMGDSVYPDTVQLNVGGKTQMVLLQPVKQVGFPFTILTDIIGSSGENTSLVRLSSYKSVPVISFHGETISDAQLNTFWDLLDNHLQVMEKPVKVHSCKLSRRGAWNHKGMKHIGYDCTLEDKPFITYRFSNYHPDIAENRQRESIQNALKTLTKVTGQHFVEVVATEQIDLMITFDKIDSIGNTLAETNIPMCGSNYTYTVVFDVEDNWTTHEAKYDNEVNDIESIALHEFEHVLGLDHVDDVESTMFYSYGGGERRRLSFSDIERLQLPYVLKKKPKKEFFYTKASSEQQITRNFKNREFASKCADIGGHQRVDKRLAKAVQIIRNYYNRPVYLTSLQRSDVCNQMAGGAQGSKHLDVPTVATDFKFGTKALMQDYAYEITTEGALFQMLIQAGVRGFGLYEDHFHIDFRDEPDGSSWEWKGIKYTFWDYTNSKKAVKGTAHKC